MYDMWQGEIESKGVKHSRAQEEEDEEEESGRDEGFTYWPSITGFHVEPSHSWTPR